MISEGIDGMTGVWHTLSIPRSLSLRSFQVRARQRDTLHRATIHTSPNWTETSARSNPAWPQTQSLENEEFAQ